MKCPCCGQIVHETPFTVLLDLNQAVFGEKSVSLTPQETEIAYVLQSRYPLTASFTAIITCLYGAGEEPEDANGVVRVHVYRLRRKLQRLGVKIETILNRGYRLSYEKTL